MKPHRMPNGRMIPRKRRALLMLANPRHKRYCGAANRHRLIGLKIAIELAWQIILSGDKP